MGSPSPGRRSGFSWKLLARALLILAAASAVHAEEDFRAQEREMARMINVDRAGNHLPPLEYDDRLADVARRHSADMRDHKFFAHESPRTGRVDSRLAAARIQVVVARENLADAPDVRAAQDGLLKSPHHYENIMARDVSRVGVGITRGGEHPENLLFTQVFSRPYVAEPPQAARDRMLGAIRAARSGKGLPALDSDPRLDALADGQTAKIHSVPAEGDVKKITRSLSERLRKRPVPGLRGLSVDVQYMSESGSFKVPAVLLQPGAGLFGVSVRQVPDDKKRALLLVLVLAGT